MRATGSWIEWAEAKLLGVFIWWTFWRALAVERRAIVADISDREVVVALLAHLGLPPFAPQIARAQSPGFDFT